MFLRVKQILILTVLFSFNQEIYSQYLTADVPGVSPAETGYPDTVICDNQSWDTLQKTIRFDHTDNGSDFYSIKLCLFCSDFERLFFYEKARERGIFITDKHEFHNDSASFVTSIDKDRFYFEIRELLDQTKQAGLLTSEADKKGFISSSPFYNIKTTPQINGVNVTQTRENECTGAEVSCSANIYSYPAGTSGNAPPPVDGYPNYGCLGSTPCPAWFYMQVGVAGNIIISIVQSDGHDVDFICWGPFTSLTDGCATGLTGTCNIPAQPPCCNNNAPGCNKFYPRGNITDCSYSPNATETCNILNAQVGEIYILLITNFSQQPGTITFSQTGGNGVTNCNIVVFCSVITITTNPSTCDSLTNTFTLTGNVEFSNPPVTGTLTVTDSTAAPPVSQTFNAPFTSPLAYNLTNIPCDGLIHSVTAVFSDSVSCTLTEEYQAPPANCPNGQISGGGTICDDGISTVTVNINIGGSPGPYNFTYAINGLSQPPVTNYSGPFPYQINTRIPGLYTLVSVSNTVCPAGGTVSGSATVILNPLPTATIFGTTAVCQNSSPPQITFTGGSASAPYTFTYNINGGTNTTVTTTTGNSVTVDAPTDIPGIFIYNLVSVQDGSSPACSQTQTGSDTVTVNALPTATISGTTTVCQNSPAPQIIFTGGSGTTLYTFTYNINGGANQYVSTISGNSVTITAPTNVTGIFTYNLVSVQDGSPTACSQPQTGNATVTVNALPTAAVSGTTDVCQNSTPPQVTFTGGSTSPPYTFTYNINGGANQIVTTTVGSSITVDAPTNIPGIYTYNLVSVQDGNSPACSQLQTGTATVTVNPLPAATITGTITVCRNSSSPQIIFTGSAATAPYTFTYNINGGANQTVTTTGGNSVSVDAPTDITGIFIYNLVSVQDGSSPPCSRLQSGSVSITVNELPTGSISGTTELCQNSPPPPITFTGGSTTPPYTFTYNINGGIIQTITTTVGNTVSINAPTNIAGIFTYNLISVQDGSSPACSQLQPGSATVTIQPLPVSTFTGSNTVCELHPDPYLYTPDSGPVASYTWSITPPSYGTIANPNASPASVIWNTTGQATLRLDAITPFGCTSFSSEPVTINPRPEVSITPCFDLVTNRSAKRFLLKGGRPLLTSTPMQGEYLISPATVALVFDAGNYYFDPTLVAGTQTITFNISYKYTSSQFGCPATSPTSVALIVRGVNPPCGTTMTDYRDIPPSTYRTAFTAGRCWMMENLRYGTSLTPTTTYQTDNCVTEKYCLPSDATCTSYGGLYQWDELIQYGVTAAPDYQGVCPPGWHIPSAADYQALIDANQGNGMAGILLSDLYMIPRGFEALLGGMYYLNTSWAFTSNDIPYGTLFWTSTPGSGNKIITRGMNNKVPSVSLYETGKGNSFALRCVKD